MNPLHTEDKRVVMTATKERHDREATPDVLVELDRVKLKKAVDTEGRTLRQGLTGTIVLCHGTRAYEVEFDGIHDVFGVGAEYLDKI